MNLTRLITIAKQRITGTTTAVALVLASGLLLASAAQAKEAVDFFGGAGELGGQFNSQGPNGIAINETGAGAGNAGDIYTLDNNNRIERFGRDDHGTPSDTSDDTYFFISAWGADVVSPGGTGDVGNSEAKAYEICTAAAQCQAGVASPGNGSTSGDGSLDEPRGIAVDQDTGRVYVSEGHGRRISVYEGDGAFLFSLGRDVDATNAGSGYEVCPATDVCRRGEAGSGLGEIGETSSSGLGLTISPPDGNLATGALYLADPGNQRVNTYHLDGSSPGSIGSAATFKPGFPTNLAVDSRGILYAGNTIPDGSDPEIERYDSENANGVGVGFLTPLRSSTNEIQQLDPANATGGQYRLTFGAETTADIPYNAGAEMIKAALEALPSIDKVGIITVFIEGAQSYFIVFSGNAVANTNVPQLVVSNGTTPLTGTIGVSTRTNGFGGGTNETQEVTVAATNGTFRLSFDPDGAGPKPAETTQDIPYNWPARDSGNNDGVINSVRDALQALPSIPERGVEVSEGHGDSTGSNPYRITFQGALAATDVAQLTCSDGSKPLSGGAGCSVSTGIPGHGGLIPGTGGIFAVDPDSDGAGPDSDVLYVGGFSAIQQFGPLNAPGLSLPPTADDARHGTGPAFSFAHALAAEPSTGRLYAGVGEGSVEGPGVYVLDDVSPGGPEGTLDSTNEVTAHGFTAHATIDPNGAPDTSYRFEYVTDAAYQASSNERQRITLNNAGGGIFTLTFSGQTTAPLSFDASPETVEAALAALPSIGGGNVAVSGFAAGPYTIEFQGELAEADQPELSADSSLTPAEASISVQTNANGRAKDRFLHAQSTSTVDLGHQEDPQSVSERIEPPGPGLSPNTTYHVRLIFQRRFSTEQQGGELSQATLAAAPDIETTGSPLRTASTATLLGRVDPNGSPTTYSFQYGTQGPCDSNPCTETDPIDAGEGKQIELASQQVTGLSPDTTYHYRIAASNGVGGTVYGSDRTLVTRASDAPLSHGEFPGPPDSDRAWEQVSIPDSSGNPAGYAGGARAYASDGNRVVYTIFGGTPISDEGSFWAPYIAERPSGQHPTTGWQTHPITPPRAQVRTVQWAESIGGADDLSSLIAVNGNLVTEPSIWRLHAKGPATLLSDVVLPTQIAPLNTEGLGDPRNAYATSADGSRVIAALRFGSLDPAFPAAAQQPNLYDISNGGTPQLASILPSGQPPACGVFGRGGTADHSVSLATHWVSSDGSRLYFNASNCSSAGLYVRNLLSGQTKLLSGPVISGPTCPAALVLSTDQAAFITTQSRLDPNDVAPSSCDSSSQDSDVYRYDPADESLKCLTCVVDGVPADVAGSLSGIAIDPEGKRLYFTTEAPLLPGVPKRAIYRIDVATGDLAYVAPPGAAGVGLTAHEANISSDGRFLSFYSDSPLLDPLGGAFQNDGKAQHYIYDDADRSLVCASCPPDGSAPLAAASAETANGHAGSPGANGLADDGTLLFSTDTPLTGADQNTSAGPDTASGRDVYEFRDGRPLLISDGTTSWPGSIAAPHPLAITPSGRDVFFTAAARYTQDASDDFTRVYDARVGGGIDFPPASLPPCDLNSGACESPPSAGLEQPGAGSAVFQGPGNGQGQGSGKRCAKNKVKRKGACVAKKHKHKAKKRHDRGAHR